MTKKVSEALDLAERVARLQIEVGAVRREFDVKAEDLAARVRRLEAMVCERDGQT